jgi:outer membrane biosynthesis protein TonB
MGILVWQHHYGGISNKKPNDVFVDVKLLKFGKKRDISFLPHVESAPRVPDQHKIKVTDNPERPKERPKEQPKPNLDKIFDEVKNMRVDDDNRVTKEATEEGDPHGIRGGTAAEASGDPYIQAIVAAVVERWTVPTMLTPGELSKLQAAACLKIDDDGRLVEFKITEPSGNSLFDGSLLSTLGSIKELPKPQGRFAGAARAGRLCPSFSKQ